jgi:RimJ/RimL family protein N-acetyltransferase
MYLNKFKSINFIENGKNITLELVDATAETVSLITKWRTENIFSFTSYFTPSEEKTRKWLKHAIEDNRNTILLLILVNGEKIGYIGLDDSTDNMIYITSVLRGESVNLPRMMENVIKNLINYAFSELNVLIVRLNVFSNNHKAINLYERCNMLTIGSIPVKKTMTHEGWTWEEYNLDPDPSIYAERYMNIMEIRIN